MLHYVSLRHSQHLGDSCCPGEDFPGPVHSQSLHACFKGNLLYCTGSFPFVYEVLDFFVNHHDFINTRSAAKTGLKTPLTTLAGVEFPAVMCQV